MKIYGYKVSNGGSLEFTIENPIEAMDGFTKILYADTSVIFMLDDNLYRNVRIHNDPSPAANVIYRYDIAKKEKTEFYRTASIRPFGGLYNSARFYISKVKSDKFIFAAGVPNLDNKNTASLTALSYIFDAESKTLNGGALIPLLNVPNRTLYQIPDPYSSCLFQLNAANRVPSTATTGNDYSTGEDLEYVSFGLENFDVHIQKNPVFFTTESMINQIGNLYIVNINGIHFITKDLLNFYLIPFKKNKTTFSHVIFLPKQNKYCYIEVDNNRSGEIYIYEILNLDNNFLNL